MADNDLTDNEARRRWAVEIASRVFCDQEDGTNFCVLAKEIEQFAKAGDVPKPEEK